MWHLIILELRGKFMRDSTTAWRCSWLMDFLMSICWLLISLASLCTLLVIGKCDALYISRQLLAFILCNLSFVSLFIVFYYASCSNGALLQLLVGSYYSEKIPEVWFCSSFIHFSGTKYEKFKLCFMYCFDWFYTIKETMDCYKSCVSFLQGQCCCLFQQ